MKLIFAAFALLFVACGGNNDEPKEMHYDVDFRASHLVGSYHGTEYSEACNYNIVFSDHSADSDAFAPNASYYYFEIYSDVYSSGGAYVDLPVAAGTSIQYRYDPNNTRRGGTFAAEYSYAIVTDDMGNPTKIAYSSGRLNIKRNGTAVEIEAELEMSDGTLHRVKYSGGLAFKNLNNEPYSTLDSNLELDIADAAIYTELLGSYRDGIDCHYIMLSEDADFENGATVILELLKPEGATDLYGNYNALSISDIHDDSDYFYTFFPGAIEQESLRGAWYLEMEGGAVGTIMAPIADGRIVIAESEDGVTTFSFDCIDDAGHKIMGTIGTRVAL